MKKFVSGMLVGTAITVAALAGVATTIKKTVIDPIEEKEDMIEEIKKMTVVELADLVKAIEEEFGVSAVAAAAPAVGAAVGAAAEEKTSFNVVLKEAGDQKIKVIKVVRDATGLGLKEAKELVDGAPKTVKENVSKDEAEELKAKFTEVGAVIELQ